MRGNGRVFQRGSIWWISFYHNGREHRESSGSTERKKAVKLLRQRLGELAAGEVSGSPLSSRRTGKGAVMMEALFDLLQQNYQLSGRGGYTEFLHLRRLRKRFAGHTVDSCTSQVIRRYMADRKNRGCKPATVNREMNVLRAAFRLGYENDLVQRLPKIKRLPEYGVRNEYFTREEIDSLLPHLPENLRDVVLFAFLSGWRKGEILGLRWKNVDPAGSVIRLDPEQNKGRTVRILALEGELATIIEMRRDSRGALSNSDDHVFQGDGRPFRDIRVRWLKACKEAGLGHRWFHSLRRSAARNMSLLGIPEKVIMSIMGHKTRVMFDRYNIVAEADQRSYAKRIFGRDADNLTDR